MTTNEKSAVASKTQVVVITNLSTANVGNQAISEEFISLVRDAHGSEHVAAMGRPGGLDAYSLADIESSDDPRKVLDGWASHLAGMAKSTSGGHQEESSLDGTGKHVALREASPGGFAKLKKRIAHHARLRYRRWIDRTGAYRDRLNTMSRAKIVYYSGAGEVRDGNVTLRQLLELRVAQKLGASVRITNQGILVKNQKLGDLLGYVYSQADSITLRGPLSKQRLIEFGVDADKIELAPDTGFLSEEADEATVAKVRAAEGIKPGTVALAVPLAISGPAEKWEPVISHLRSMGKDIVLVTNQLSRDMEGLDAISQMYGIRIISHQYDYRDYMGILAGCDFIISGRMHTNIFGLMSCVPVIPIEADTFKLHDLFAMVGDYPIEVTDPGKPDWQQELISKIDMVERDNASLRERLLARRPELRSKVLANVN